MTFRFAILGARGYPSTYGGFETFVRRFAPYLVEHGDAVTVYCRGDQPSRADVSGVNTITTRGIDSRSASTITYGLTSILHARKEPYDAALVLNVANGFFLPLLRRAGIPTGVNVDGIEWERGKWSRAGKATFLAGARHTARWADEIIVDSKAIGGIWGRQFGRPGRFIPYGADVVDHVPHERISELRLSERAYALAVARIVPENNIDLFLDALDSLDFSFPAVVVGTGHPKSPTVQRLRAYSRLGRIVWLGHVDDQGLLAQLWGNAGAYFHGHSVGGTNPALLQALGYGAPSIALHTPFNAEVIQTADALFPNDPPAVAKLLERCIRDASYRHQLVTSGQDTIRQRYSWDYVLGAYRDLLVELSQTGLRRVAPA